MSDYAKPEALVSTQWVADHQDDPDVRIIESNEDALLYPSGHIASAVEVDWTSDLNHQIVRDYIGKAQFEELASRIGITPQTTVVFYGDKSNWWATYAFWVFQLFGHTRAKIMNGGRQKWIAEARPLTRDIPQYAPTHYHAPERDDTRERAFRDEVLAYIQEQGQLVDVRSPAEFTGERLHMEGYPQEGTLRGGHIPGATNIPWGMATQVDGTFKNAADLCALYIGERALNPDKEVITYCRIGERSSHTWFVLKYLLGFDNVRNYDGSWTEWGNSVGVPIEK